MQNSYNYFRSFIVFILLNLFIIDAYSISISTRRLYLDPKSDSTSIRILNLDAKVQQCSVQIKDIDINEKGLIKLTNNDVATENSAKPLIRLAPRRFTLDVKEHQMVRVLYRRKPDVENGEYQGVLAIKCKEQSGPNGEQVKVEAALVHNVPVIVRTGKLPIKAQFLSTNMNKNKLDIELQIQGDRSITGDLLVTDISSGDVVVKQNDISIYAQQPLKKISLNIGDYKKTPMLLTFTENPKFGGELTIKQRIE